LGRDDLLTGNTFQRLKSWLSRPRPFPDKSGPTVMRLTMTLDFFDERSNERTCRHHRYRPCWLQPRP
ncbi:hypothetical protein, partial [Pseudomonas cichorii]|uniref:hypothetical protein n=1 Tax=Pseudomonas cichorii TaxID=36746 RepID=UPI001C8A297E